MQVIAKLKIWLNILTISCRKRHLHHGNETIEHRRDDPRLGSAFLGSLECLVQQALDDIYCQNIFLILTFAITYEG